MFEQKQMLTALITGITGQGGSYLAEYLLSLGYTVYGAVRRASCDNTANLREALANPRLVLLDGDVTDYHSVLRILDDYAPQEVYHLADQDHVGFSLNTPLYSCDVTYKGTANVLQAVRESSLGGGYTVDGFATHRPRVFLPCSATMFGATQAPHTLQSPLNPQSPYACAKAGVYHLGRHYQREYGLDVRIGVLYNHESLRRKETYFLQRVCHQAVKVKQGLQAHVTVSEANPRISVGWAEQFVREFHFLTALKRQEEPPPAHMVSGYGRTELEWINLALELAGLPAEKYVCVTKAKFRPGPVFDMYPEGAGRLPSGATSLRPEEIVARIIQKYHRLYREETL